MHVAFAVRSTMDVKIIPHSSMVVEKFSEVLEKRASGSLCVVHLRAQLTQLHELTWSKSNSAMRRGVLTDEDGRSLHVTFMSQIAEDLQVEAGGGRKFDLHVDVRARMGHWSAMLLSHPATVCLLVIVRCNRSSVAREVGDVVTVFYRHQSHG